MSTNPLTTPRILIAPDKFKGSLTAAQVADSLAAGLLQENPLAQVHTLPLADGGDGSVAAALGAGFQALTIPITGPTGEPTTTTVAFDGTTAVVEVATTAGLQMLPAGRLAPQESNSVGFGQAIRAVLAHRPAQIVLALGGSATTDGGAGMLAALGVVFTDRAGQAFVPTGATLGTAAISTAPPAAAPPAVPPSRHPADAQAPSAAAPSVPAAAAARELAPTCAALHPRTNVRCFAPHVR